MISKQNLYNASNKNQFLNNMHPENYFDMHCVFILKSQNKVFGKKYPKNKSSASGKFSIIVTVKLFSYLRIMYNV